MWRRLKTLSDNNIFMFLSGLFVGAVVMSLLVNEDSFRTWFSGLAQNFGTEMAGAIITFWLFDKVIGERKEKEQLLRDSRSQVLEVRHRAIEEIIDKIRKGHLKWEVLHKAKLYEVDLSGIHLQEADLSRIYLPKGQLKHADLRNAVLKKIYLRRADLRSADLQNADLEGADLQRANLLSADLRNVNLQNADLQGANLESASLRKANLLKAKLGDVDLQKADLREARLESTTLKGANLQNAGLQNANLQGSTLYGVNLRGANMLDVNLQETKFNEETILPDGTNWTSDTDMERFTNPNHPDFYDARPIWRTQ